MLRHASRCLFVARNRALLAASTRATGGSVPLTKEDANFQKQADRQSGQWAAMRKVGADQEGTNAQRFEDRYQEREQAPSLWERAKEAAQAVKDSVASNAEKAQEAATNAKDNMSEKMQSASESIKESYVGAKETIAEKYDDAKEAVGEKLDNISDSLQGRKGSSGQQKKDLSRSQPLGKLYTKVDMSLKAMNEEVTLADMQGNMSHDDEVIAHAAARSESADAFHSMDNISNSLSTEDLTIQGKLRTDAQAAAEHRADREKNKKYRDITYSGDEQFFEPQQQINREKQNFSENIKDTKQAAEKTWDKAGSNFVRGLEKTAEHIQRKDAKKFDQKEEKSMKPEKSAQQLWEEGKSVTQSWNEVMEASEKKNEKEEKSQRKGPAFGLEDLTGPDVTAKKSDVKKQDKEAVEQQAKELERGKRQKKGPMYGMEDLTGGANASVSKADQDRDQDDDQDDDREDREDNRQAKKGKGKENKEARNKDDKQARNKDDKEACSLDQKRKQAKKGQVEDKDERNMAERSQKASASSKARGANDVQGLSQSKGDDAANEKARNIALGTPASSTY